MCKHKYKTPEFNRSNCKIEEIIDKLIESGEENILDHIPYDNDGLCIFHSPKLEWKQELNVMNYLRRLIKGISKLNENNGDYLNYTFAEYNLIYKDQYSDELNDLTFDTYCDFRGAIFNNTIQIRNASFNSANFKGAVFKSFAIFENVDFQNVFLSEVTTDNIVFNKVRVGEVADFHSFKCLNFARFEKSEFGKTDFRKSSFTSNSDQYDVTFKDSIFKGDVTFDNATFSCELNFIDVEFSTVALFTDVNFSEKLKTNFKGLKIKGVLLFKSTDMNKKMFPSSVRLVLEESEVTGLIRFENVNFLNIAKPDRSELRRMELLDKVKIGPGCLKYRIQTPTVTVPAGLYTKGIIEELSISFTNYFILSNGINLGVEFVSKQIDNIQLFYYTDEDITISEFYERLGKTEQNYWNFDVVNDKVSTPKDIVSLIDSYTSRLSILAKIKLRSDHDLWDSNDTKELLRAISFGTSEITGREINVQIQNLNIESGVKINRQENFGGSHQFGDDIHNLK